MVCVFVVVIVVVGVLVAVMFIISMNMAKGCGLNELLRLPTRKPKQQPSGDYSLPTINNVDYHTPLCAACERLIWYSLINVCIRQDTIHIHGADRRVVESTEHEKSATRKTLKLPSEFDCQGEEACSHDRWD